MTAPLAAHVLASLQSWVLDALRVNMHVLSPHREVRSIDAIVDFARFGRPLVVVAKFALELKEAALSCLVLLSL